MLRLSMSVVVACLVVTSCGSDEPDRASSPSGSPTPSPSPSSDQPDLSASPTFPNAAPTNPDLPNDPAAAQAVEEGLHGLIGLGTGAYVVDVDLGPGTAIHEEGRYQIEPNAYQSTRHLVSPHGTVTFAYRAVGKDTWVRLEQAGTVSGGDSKAWPCWAHIGDPQVVADQLDLPLMATGQPPSALVAASYAVGLGFVDEEPGKELGNVLGTTDLVLSLALLNAKVVASSGLDPSSDATTLAYFTVRKGVLLGYTIGLRGLFSALEAAGGTLPDGIDPDGAVPGSIEVAFSDLGKPVTVQPPAADEVVELTADHDAFEDDLRSCGGGA
jgi:hypothetical protein